MPTIKLAAGAGFSFSFRRPSAGAGMSTVDSDSDVRLSAEFTARERDRWRTLPEAAEAEPTPPAPPLADEEAAPGNLFGRLATAPSWLVSLVVHLLALIALGMFTFSTLQPPEPATITVASVEEYALETFTDVVITPPLENVEHQVVDAPAGALAEMADVTEDSALGDSSGSVASTDLDAIDVGAMEDLFGSAGQGLKNVGGGQGSAEFFGVKAGGRKFVFVVDSSNSMRGEKFKEAKEELLYAVRRLDKTQAFYVLFFDQDALRMFVDGDNEPETRPLPANVPNVRKLEKWLPTVENERRTDPYDAMKIALEMRPDAIFILSDGQFTDRGRTERYLAESNVIDDPVDGRRPRVVVHTIAFYSRDGEPTMQAIAKAYKGTYRFVPRPANR
jgi:hypothetical protein